MPVEGGLKSFFAQVHVPLPCSDVQKVTSCRFPLLHRRLYTMSTLAQLDEGFGHQAIANYKYILKLLEVGMASCISCALRPCVQAVSCTLNGY